MNVRPVFLLLLLTACGCQHALSPEEVRAALDQREQEWRAFVAEKYNLPALTAFLDQTVAEWKILGGLDLSTQRFAPTWTVGGSVMKSGDWYFNAWDLASDTFTLHATFSEAMKRVTFHCLRVSQTEFKVQKVTVEDLPDEVIV